MILFKESDAYFNPTAIRTSYIGFAEGNPKFHITSPSNHKQYIIIFIIKPFYVLINKI
tara:strand:+ start:96 stop:269 length:174 start_codon:yes stop_codon:yes gene_type:complete